MARGPKVPFASRYETSMAILKQSWNGLRAERDLWRFPIIGGAISLVIIGLMIAAMFGLNAALGLSVAFLPLWAVILIPVFLPFSVLISIYQGALVYGLWMRAEGEEVTPAECMAASRKYWKSFVALNVVGGLVAGVFAVLGQLLDKLNLVPYLGRITQSIGMLAWAAASFFVMPIIVLEGERKLAGAIRESADLARDQWGKAVTGIVTISLALMVPFVAASVVLMFGSMGFMTFLMFSGVPVSPIAFGVVIGGSFILLMVPYMIAIQATQTTYQTALYRYARTNEITPPYTRASLVDAWAPYQE